MEKPKLALTLVAACMTSCIGKAPTLNGIANDEQDKLYDVTSTLKMNTSHQENLEAQAVDKKKKATSQKAPSQKLKELIQAKLFAPISPIRRLSNSELNATVILALRLSGLSANQLAQVAEKLPFEKIANRYSTESEFLFAGQTYVNKIEDTAQTLSEQKAFSKSVNACQAQSWNGPECTESLIINVQRAFQMNKSLFAIDSFSALSDFDSQELQSLEKLVVLRVLLSPQNLYISSLEKGSSDIILQRLSLALLGSKAGIATLPQNTAEEKSLKALAEKDLTIESHFRDLATAILSSSVSESVLTQFVTEWLGFSESNEYGGIVDSMVKESHRNFAGKSFHSFVANNKPLNELLTHSIDASGKTLITHGGFASAHSHRDITSPDASGIRSAWKTPLL